MLSVYLFAGFSARRPDLDNGTRVLHNHISTCKLASVTYDVNRASDNQFTVSHEFAEAVCRLPLAMDDSAMSKYMQFLDDWGTVGTKDWTNLI